MNTFTIMQILHKTKSQSEFDTPKNFETNSARNRVHICKTRKLRPRKTNGSHWQENSWVLWTETESPVSLHGGSPRAKHPYDRPVVGNGVHGFQPQIPTHRHAQVPWLTLLYTAKHLEKTKTLTLFRTCLDSDFLQSSYYKIYHLLVRPWLLVKVKLLRLFFIISEIKWSCERSKDVDRGRNLSYNLFKPLGRLAGTSKQGILKTFFFQLIFQTFSPLPLLAHRHKLQSGGRDGHFLMWCICICQNKNLTHWIVQFFGIGSFEHLNKFIYLLL